jgi:hypothetical protein
MKLPIAALASLALAPTAAHADCAAPRWIGTPTGTAIPEHGSLYLFEEEYRSGRFNELEVEFADGVPHRWEGTRVSENVVRIDYAAGLASMVTADIYWGEKGTYAIDPTWKAPARAPRVLQYWHHQSEWTCSYSDSWMIQVDQPTAAFRVRFMRLDVIGNSIEYIEPAQPGEDGRSVLEIGKHNCIADTIISPETLAAGGVLELVAIRFDGSEVEVTGLPKMMRTSDMRTSDGGLSDAIGYASLPLAPPPAPPIVTNAASGQAFLVIAGAGVGLLFIGMMLAGRKRTPLPVQM